MTRCRFWYININDLSVLGDLALLLVDDEVSLNFFHLCFAKKPHRVLISIHFPVFQTDEPCGVPIRTTVDLESNAEGTVLLCPLLVIQTIYNSLNFSVLCHRVTALRKGGGS